MGRCPNCSTDNAWQWSEVLSSGVEGSKDLPNQPAKSSQRQPSGLGGVLMDLARIARW
jgi:hypothetical protein